jgi:hypothetical protein
LTALSEISRVTHVKTTAKTPTPTKPLVMGASVAGTSEWWTFFRNSNALDYDFDLDKLVMWTYEKRA